ncbi:carbon-nitrogen hydrolase family protein [Rhizobium sp. YAF28]|jgi:predicted amidohydrolase|uniref:carbon-nitrogen hydrolase family protein n=1 Tax=Rhizobium sp. YAF28 TaxID=3233081 RepID=UPI003F94476C
MTRNGNFKRRVRTRAAKTGESYTSALSHIRAPQTTSQTEPQTDGPAGKSLRLAVAQTTVRLDPRDADAFRANGAEMRRLMRQARDAGARLLHFSEGTICFPNKRILSEIGPAEIGAADWSRYQWEVLREELEEIRKLARELKLWTVFGAPHRLTPPHRPHNSLYVVSDRGELVTRYDERLLSHTKISFMYSPGKIPVTFEVDGLRFGCAAGMESHYPEIFIEYERLDVDCVLFSTSGETPSAAPPFAAEVLGLAASNTYWVSYASHAPQSVIAPCGIAAPNGQWAALCPADGTPGIAFADITTNPENPARPWRRTARGDLYRLHQIEGDPRSDSREAF